MNEKSSQYTVLDEIRRLLPDGSVDTTLFPSNYGEVKIGNWDICPVWAPDIFAVVATLIEISGCYTTATCIGSDLKAHNQYLQRVFASAKDWEASGVLPARVEILWNALIQFQDVHVSLICSNADLVELLLELFAITDEACVGVGWSSPIGSAAKRTFLSFVETPGDTAAPPPLPHRPHSLCERVPPNIAIVLPKALTPAVGCTLRTLSHHLCLLPGKSIVSPRWYLADESQGNGGGVPENEMRLLIIPFPFHILGTSFVKNAVAEQMANSAKAQGYFGLSQTWLKLANGKEILAETLANELVIPLLDAARKETGKGIHGIVLPECALSTDLGKQLADVLALKAEQYGLQFLISGVLSSEKPARNLAMSYIFDKPKIAKTVNADVPTISEGYHSKHHRWCLDRTQVKRYGQSDLFDEETEKWWEDINVAQRELPFFAIREDLCMTVLICEDLARADPAMPVIRAVGPNLVVALLMDGPQLTSRWPARYATVLADDPGSSVLTITCAGMVDRSNYLEKHPVRSIGLWRHSNGHMQELYLPENRHGLLLTLRSTKEEQFTLDHRSDRKLTSVLELECITPLALNTVPKWLDSLEHH